MISIKRLYTTGIAALAFAAPFPTSALIIYDNFTSVQGTSEFSDYGYTALFRVDVAQTIGGIGARVSMPDAGNLKFVLFDPFSEGSPLLFSQAASFAADADYNYKYSDPFTYNLLAGKWYAVGVIAEPGSIARISFDDAAGVSPGAGFTAAANSYRYFSSYLNPVVAGGFLRDDCCNVHYQLTSAVPEPMTLVLFGLGLAGLGFSRRCRPD